MIKFHLLFQVHVEFVEDKDKIICQGPPVDVQAVESLLNSSLAELVSAIAMAVGSFVIKFT